MLSLQDKLERLKTALVSVTGTKTYHYFRPRLEAPYLIWAESHEERNATSDNHKDAQTIFGTIDYYTRTEFDGTIDAIQNAVNGVDGIAWQLNSVQFEEQTNLIHYEWYFWLI